MQPKTAPSHEQLGEAMEKGLEMAKSLKLWELKISAKTPEGNRETYTEPILAETPEQGFESITKRWKSTEPRLESSKEIPLEPGITYRRAKS